MKTTLRQMLERFGSRSIYVRLTLYAVVIISFTTILRVGVVTAVLDLDAHKIAADNPLAAANYIARDIDGAVRLRFDLLKLLSGEVPKGSRAQVKSWLDGNLASRVLFPAGLDFYALADAAGEEWFPRAQESREPIIARLYFGPNHRGLM